MTPKITVVERMFGRKNDRTRIERKCEFKEERIRVKNVNKKAQVKRY